MQKDLDEEDPEEDYADVEIVSNVEEPKLDLQLSEVMVARNYLTLMQPSL